MLRSVTAIAVPDVTPFELGLLCEVFGIDRRDTGGPAFDFKVCAPEPGTVSTDQGFSLTVPHGLDSTESADLVVVSAYSRDRALPEPLLDSLRAAHARGAWVMSLCGGASALGQAGLLDGRRCTTHWMLAADLAAAFPLAEVDPDVLYVEDDGVITSAGTASGIDACLHIVRRELGASMAANIARRMVVPPHRDGGQAQYVDMPIPYESEALAPVLDWASEHLDSELSVAVLARRATMSERTFARRFRAETGTTPAAWLTRQRLALAQSLLETTDLAIEEVAKESGFGSSAVLRHHFARTFGVSPLVYRKRFAVTAPHADAASRA